GRAPPRRDPADRLHPHPVSRPGVRRRASRPDRAPRGWRAQRPDRASGSEPQVANPRELPSLAARTRRGLASYALTETGRSTWGLVASSSATRVRAAWLSGASGSRARPHSSPPSCSLTHLAGTGLVSAKAAL